MKTRLLRGICFALCLFALPALAQRNVNVRIMGVDAYCSSFAVSSDQGNSVFTCVPASSTPGAPAGCVATVNSASSLSLTSAGGVANLAASCATPTSGITWNWSKNGVSGASTSASWTDTLAANPSTTVANVYRYQARACNGVSCAYAPASTTLPVTVAAVGGGGGTWSGTCGGFDHTAVLTLNWASPARLYSSNAGGFAPGDALVIQFTTGSVSSTTSLPRVAAAEFNSPPSERLAFLSATPCDFGHQSAPGANIDGNSVTAVFAIGTGSGFGYYPVLATNTTYYLNIRNAANSTCSTLGACDMFVDLIKAGGL